MHTFGFTNIQAANTSNFVPVTFLIKSGADEFLGDVDLTTPDALHKRMKGDIPREAIRAP